MISSTCFGQTFAHLQERKTEVFFTTCGIMSCLSSSLHTVHTVPRCRAPNPCLPQQQDTIPHVVKKTSVLRSWRWAKVCPKHIELNLEINKTVIVASRWFLYYLTYLVDFSCTPSLLRTGYHCFFCKRPHIEIFNFWVSDFVSNCPKRCASHTSNDFLAQLVHGAEHECASHFLIYCSTSSQCKVILFAVFPDPNWPRLWKSFLLNRLTL